MLNDYYRYMMYMACAAAPGLRNGALHPRGCGAATHLGITVDLPAIGVAKDVLQVEPQVFSWGYPIKKMMVNMWAIYNLYPTANG
jgi:hypothetical protein